MTASPSSQKPAADSDDLLLLIGGPLFQMLRRARLSDDALLLIQRRIVAFVLICWVPLVVLAALQGQLYSSGIRVPLLMDVSLHIRFLIVVPMLLVSELVVHGRVRSINRQFLERNMIAERDLPRFRAAIDSTMRLRNSVLAEILLLAAVYVGGILFVFRHYAALDTTSWIGLPGATGESLSLAGVWFGFVSLPIFQFLLVRWYFRLFVWARYLWLVSRIDLQLIASHPDRVGGIGFLSNCVQAFSLLIMAQGALIAGVIADRILFLGAQLTDFKIEIAVWSIFLLCLIQGPLIVFTPQLAKARQAGRREYGILAERYVRAFDHKWLRGGAPQGEELVGSADLQSLADLASSVEIVQSMGTTLLSKEAVLTSVGALVLPMLPLVLTMIPIGDLAKMLVGVLI